MEILEEEKTKSLTANLKTILEALYAVKYAMASIEQPKENTLAVSAAKECEDAINAALSLYSTVMESKPIINNYPNPQHQERPVFHPSFLKPDITCKDGDVPLSSNHDIVFFDKNGEKEFHNSMEEDLKTFLEEEEK